MKRAPPSDPLLSLTLPRLQSCKRDRSMPCAPLSKRPASSLSTSINPACGCESRVKPKPREAIPGFNPETDVRKALILGARDY
jgi:hypothetical protein